MCYQCQRRNKQVVKCATLHFYVATFPMQFISMDLIGQFHPPTSRKHRYALMVICMLTSYVFNLGDEQTITPSMSDMQEDLIRMSSEDNLKANHLNL